MTAASFRKIALSMAGAVEGSHMGHSDFRVNGKIFATLGYPDGEHGVVMLTPEEQSKMMRANPRVFSPAAGAWGRGGSTLVRLEAASAGVVRKAMSTAWQNRQSPAKPTKRSRA